MVHVSNATRVPFQVLATIAQRTAYVMGNSQKHLFAHLKQFFVFPDYPLEASLHFYGFFNIMPNYQKGNDQQYRSRGNHQYKQTVRKRPSFRYLPFTICKSRLGIGVKIGYERMQFLIQQTVLSAQAVGELIRPLLPSSLHGYQPLVQVLQLL